MICFRREELEANRLEEIVSGGFIPPAEDLDAKNFDVEIETYVFFINLKHTQACGRQNFWGGYI